MSSLLQFSSARQIECREIPAEFRWVECEKRIYAPGNNFQTQENHTWGIGNLQIEVYTRFLRDVVHNECHGIHVQVHSSTPEASLDTSR